MKRLEVTDSLKNHSLFLDYSNKGLKHYPGVTHGFVCGGEVVEGRYKISAACHGMFKSFDLRTKKQGTNFYTTQKLNLCQNPEHGERWWAFFNSPKVSPYRNILDLTRIFEGEEPYSYFGLEATDQRFLGIFAWAVSTRAPAEKPKRVKLWCDLVDAGADPVEALIICSIVTYNSENYLLMNGEYDHWVCVLRNQDLAEVYRRLKEGDLHFENKGLPSTQRLEANTAIYYESDYILHSLIGKNSTKNNSPAMENMRLLINKEQKMVTGYLLNRLGKPRFSQIQPKSLDKSESFPRLFAWSREHLKGEKVEVFHTT